MTPGQLPEEAYAVALAAAPSVGPATLRRLLAGGLPSEVWTRRRGAEGGSVREVAHLWARHTERHPRAHARSASWPARLDDDPQAPTILFCLGDPSALQQGPTVALVGTRAPTRYGIGVAAQLGADLSAAGVSVVSGLALGIDGAAHEGACGTGASPIGVVAGGLDDPYRGGTRGCGSASQNAAPSCRSHRPGCPRRSGGSRYATASSPP